ncbi:MAG TPA: single-stranded-DNA-specific exonuclease RecJ [Burkholderiales bacterium]|nr:single-stranded-DNA-specific exonuclease RecJ [Burkholderiales bacterium]
MRPLIVERAAPDDAVQRLIEDQVPPVLARLYAARGIAGRHELALDLSRLLGPEPFLNLRRMAGHLADAMDRRETLAIVADYDADGATACAVGIRALRAFGARVHYLVPDRMRHGYGLTPEIVREARDTWHPDVLITVDNGIASVEGVAEANRLGIRVIITDHHLPGATLPDAWCIVNPNQSGCAFPSKHLAGVGVMFYLMAALRSELRARGAFRTDAAPKLANLLDLVALGTVADVVRLDHNNRILVHQGLGRIRRGRAQAGIRALFEIAGRDARAASAYDLGFVLGPRLNAAGRLADMTIGIECLITDDEARARSLGRQLDTLNRERRAVEAEMHAAALGTIENMPVADSYTLALFDPAWHPGVVGIVASRLKERLHRPTIAFARAGDGEIRGSGRSIAGLHLRDLLDRIAKREPDLLLRFGGHAAAAGMSLRERDLRRFSAAFEAAAREILTPVDLERQLESDGSLAAGDITLDLAFRLRNEVWGAGFPEPRFHDTFEVREQRVVGEKHLRLQLSRDERRFEAMLFGETARLPERISALYRLDVNEYNGSRAVQLAIEHWHAAGEQ